MFDLNNDKTIDKREFVTVAALNDKLIGHVTESAQAPLELDLDMLAFNITAYKVWYDAYPDDSFVRSPVGILQVNCINNKNLRILFLCQSHITQSYNS